MMQRENLRFFAARPGQAYGHSLVLQDSHNCPGDLLDIADFHQQAVDPVCNQFGRAALAGGHDRQAAGPRFGYDPPEGFDAGRQDKDDNTKAGADFRQTT